MESNVHLLIILVKIIKFFFNQLLPDFQVHLPIIFSLHNELLTTAYSLHIYFISSSLHFERMLTFISSKFFPNNSYFVDNSSTLYIICLEAFD